MLTSKLFLVMTQKRCKVKHLDAHIWKGHSQRAFGKVLKVTRLTEFNNSLTQTARARFLPLEYFSCNFVHFVLRHPWRYFVPESCVLLFSYW